MTAKGRRLNRPCTRSRVRSPHPPAQAPVFVERFLHRCADGRAVLFPPWVDSVVRTCLWLLGLIVVATPLLLMAWARTPYRTGQGFPIAQPVAFDHRHHVRDDGIDCQYCHATADRAATAGLPATDVCLNCHNQIWSNSPLLAAVWTSHLTRRPIEWRRITWLPDFVFFNHRIHVTKGFGCETCHGRVDLMARVYQAKPMTMGWCLDCHRRPEAYLRPVDQVTTVAWHPDEPQPILGARLQREQDVRSLTHCSTCHR